MTSPSREPSPATLLVRGRGGGTILIGTIFKRGEQAPTCRGASDGDAPYVWVRDELYEVGSGDSETEIDGWTIYITLGTPLSRSFDTRKQALSATKERIEARFTRVGVSTGGVWVEVVRPEEEGAPEAEQPVPMDYSTDEGSPGGDALHQVALSRARIRFRSTARATS